MSLVGIQKIWLQLKKSTWSQLIWLTLVVAVCAALSAWVNRLFILPVNGDPIITGGIGGLSTIIAKILTLTGYFNPNLLIKIFGHINFFLNIPIIFLAFKIKPRFGFLTMVYIIFFYLFNQFSFHFLETIACDFVRHGLLARVIVAALIEGFLEAIVLGVGASSGGIATVSYFFLIYYHKKIKFTSVILVFNSIVISTFSFITLFEKDLTHVFNTFIFALLLTFFTKKVIDWFDFRGIQEQIQIFTKVPSLVETIKQNQTYGATMITALGMHSAAEIMIIYITVPRSEVKNIVALVHQIDPHCFINIMTIRQIYGGYFLKN